MKKKVLITGASGFVGTHIFEEYSNNTGFELFGTVFDDVSILSQWTDESHLFKLDLSNIEQTRKVVSKTNPDYVIHLAALSAPGKSFGEGAKTIANNVVAQAHLLDALLELKVLPRVLVIGSAEEYGLVSDENNPVNENTHLNPISPYAVSKIAQDYMGLQYFITHKLPVIRLRPFNHTGERRPAHFVISSFAKQIAEMEEGLMEPILRVGNLDPVRDFTDVKDMIKAYFLALERCDPGDVYNIGSGKGIRIGDVVDMLIGLSKLDIKVQVDKDRFRPADVKTLIADNTKFKQATGWETRIPLVNTVERVLNYWRDNIDK